MATEFEIKSWESWVESLFASRRNRIPQRFASQLDAYLRNKEYRVAAYDLVRAAVENDDTPSLTPGELERAQHFNELGFFGKRSATFSGNCWIHGSSFPHKIRQMSLTQSASTETPCRT